LNITLITTYLSIPSTSYISLFNIILIATYPSIPIQYRFHQHHYFIDDFVIDIISSINIIVIDFLL